MGLDELSASKANVLDDVPCNRRGSEGLAGPAGLGLKEGHVLRARGWHSQVAAAKEGGQSGFPKAHNARRWFGLLRFGQLGESKADIF